MQYLDWRRYMDNRKVKATIPLAAFVFSLGKELKILKGISALLVNVCVLAGLYFIEA